MGVPVGDPVGLLVGDPVGVPVGALVGLDVGVLVGDEVATTTTVVNTASKKVIQDKKRLAP